MHIKHKPKHRKMEKNVREKCIMCVHIKFTCCRTELEQWLLFPHCAFLAVRSERDRASGGAEWSGVDENKRILVTLLSLLIEFYLLLVFIIIIIVVAVAAATVRIVVVVVVVFVVRCGSFAFHPKAVQQQERGHRRRGKT